MPPATSAGPFAAAVILATADPSSATAVDFPGLTPADWTWYLLTWLLCTTNAADQKLQCQVNGDSTSGHYGWGLFDSNGNTSNGSDTAATLGYIPASSQSLGTGFHLIPSQHGGSTHNGSGFFGSSGTATHNGTSFSTWTFNIAANKTSIHLFAAAGNLTGHVTLCGVP